MMSETDFRPISRPLDDMARLMLDAAMAAAREINRIYANGTIVHHKPDGSPVTEADSAAEAIILDHLATTGIPILAEESVAAGRIPELGARYFVVDPLDGTKEFIKRNGEFTVNIALVEDGRPIYGTVVTPVTARAHIGTPDGAFACDTHSGHAENLQSIRVSERTPPRVVASRSHRSATVDAVCSRLGIAEDVSVGSSLKFCLLAESAAELYLRMTPTCEWDTAAGQAVVEAAGGVVLTLDKQPLSYGKATDTYYNPFFVAAASRQLAELAIDEICRLP